MTDGFNIESAGRRHNKPPVWRQYSGKNGTMVRATFLFFLLVVLPLPAAHAQMPDWVILRDRDGNRYYADPNGRIYCSGKPEFDYKPVSAEGIDYYLHQGVSLIAGHHKAEGLALLKSILALPAASARITDAQAKASLHVNSLVRKEGTRYERLAREASLLLYREGKDTTLVNDAMRYSMRIRGSVTVMRRRVREGGKVYVYYGILLGVRFEDDMPGSAREPGYDLLVAVDSERFPHGVASAARLEQSWRKNLGWDTFTRTVQERNAEKTVYSFVDAGDPRYSGFEGFFVRNNYGYCVRTISTKQKFDSRREVIAAIMRGFRI